MVAEPTFIKLQIGSGFLNALEGEGPSYSEPIILCVVESYDKFEVIRAESPEACLQQLWYIPGSLMYLPYTLYLDNVE